MNQLYNLYNTFLNYFPVAVHPLISLILALLLVYAVIRVIQKDFIFIILLVVLLPASIPILKNLWDTVFALLSFLVGHK